MKQVLDDLAEAGLEPGDVLSVDYLTESDMSSEEECQSDIGSIYELSDDAEEGEEKREEAELVQVCFSQCLTDTRQILQSLSSWSELCLKSLMEEVFHSLHPLSLRQHRIPKKYPEAFSTSCYFG
jgi:hypothetical protein